MKWLLITTTENRNTGDELIRIGVQNLIKQVDSVAEFHLFDKENINAEENYLFDKCVLCGMPLFWNNEFSYCQSVGWWGYIFNELVVERKKDFIVLGAGDVVGKSGIKDMGMYNEAIQQVVDSAYAVTTRNFISDNPKLIDSICPASFVIENPQKPELRICNLMTVGAHDKYFNPEEARIWESKIQVLSEYCKGNDFWFIEHCHPDEEYRYEHGVYELGWKPERVICFKKAEDYIDVYSRASCFVGNRIHGSLLVASIGRPSLAIGYESRLKMTKKLGSKILYPSEVSVKDIEELIADANNEFVPPDIIVQEKNKLIELLKNFMESV